MKFTLRYFVQITSVWWRYWCISNEISQEIAGPFCWTNMLDRFNQGFLRLLRPEDEKSSRAEGTLSPVKRFYGCCCRCKRIKIIFCSLLSIFI